MTTTTEILQYRTCTLQVLNLLSWFYNVVTGFPYGVHANGLTTDLLTVTNVVVHNTIRDDTLYLKPQPNITMSVRVGGTAFDHRPIFGT